MYNYSEWIKFEDEEEFAKKCQEMLKESGFTILESCEHKFTPRGYTALFLLSESHFAIHSFPEDDKIYIELSSCVKKYFDKFVEMIKEYEKNKKLR